MNKIPEEMDRLEEAESWSESYYTVAMDLYLNNWLHPNAFPSKIIS